MCLFVHTSISGYLFYLQSYHHSHQEEARDPKEWCQKIILTLSKWTSAADLQHQRYDSVIHKWMAAMYCEVLIPLCGKLKKADMQAVKHSIDDFAWLMNIRESSLDNGIKYLYNTIGPKATGKAIAAFKKF